MSLQSDLTYSAQVVRQVDEAMQHEIAAHVADVSRWLLAGLFVIVAPVLILARYLQ